MKKGSLSILSALAGAAAGAAVAVHDSNAEIAKAKKMSDKYLALFLMMDQWVRIKQEGKNVADHLEKNGYKTIAVYGMSYAGERLLDELTDSGVTVKYGIDQKADEIYSNVNVVSPDDRLEAVDAVVVTSIFFMDAIEEKLSSKLLCPILSLEDILYEI